MWGSSLWVFFVNDPATTEIYTLSLHDALPISEVLADALLVLADALELGLFLVQRLRGIGDGTRLRCDRAQLRLEPRDRKSTRLNSSHANISYAVFCLNKKQL